MRPKLQAKITGSIGKWTAKVRYIGTDAPPTETLPCLHKRYWKAGSQYYEDPDASVTNPESYIYREASKFAELFDLLKLKQRIVLTNDIVTEDRNRAEGRFEREGYVGVYDVDNVTLDERGLRFRPVKRIAEAL